MPLVIADTRQYPGWIQVPGLEYTRSWLGSPMLIKDRVIGILAVRKAQPDYYGSEDAQVVFALADQVAIAVENARLYEEARQRVDELEALRRTSLQLTSSLDLTAVLDSVTESALMLVKATDCHIYIYDEESGTFTLGSALWDDGRREPAVQMPRSDGLTATVARGGEPVVINDVPHHPLFMTREAQKWDLQAIVGFPLKRAGHVLGVFTLAFQQPHTFSEEELRVLGLLVDQAAIAIENARLYAASERRAEEMASLYEMGLATTSTLELDQQLRTLYSEIRRLFAPDTFAIVWYDPDAKEITVELAIEEDECLPKSTVPLDEGGLHGWVIKNSEALLIKDMLSEADMISVEPKHITRPARSWLGVPLVTKGRVIGAMSVQSFQPYAFDEDDKRLFISIANQAAVTIENTRLLEAEHSRRLLADTLRQVSQVVNSTLKLDEVLELVLDELRKVIAYDSVSIHLLSGNMLEIISARGFEDPTQVVGLQFSMDDDNPNRHVIRSRAPYIVPDTHAAYAAFREPPHSHIRSWLGVPLLVKDEVIGMIALDKTTTGYFSQEDAEVALTFANQVAMAIENARLYEETNLLAITDELTGLFNVRYFYHELRGEILRSERYGHSCSLIFFDIDDFKIYNDRYGHLAGDDLLREMGGILKETMRHPDTAARYGGEEFTIIQPETEQAEAVRSAQRVWRQIREHQFCVAGIGREGRITISVGVATYPRDAKTAKELVHAADMALYVAKREKDQVCVYERAQPST